MEKKQIFRFCRPNVFGLLAALIVCTALHIAPAIQAYADEEDCVYYEGTNIGTHDYYGEGFKGLRESDNSGSHAYPIESYLVECADGRYMIVQHGDMGVVVEYYDAQLKRLSSQVLPQELPNFGGFYAMGGNYYLLTGQDNPTESASVECFRLTKYDSSWKRLGSAGLYDCNTMYPFIAGSARMVDVGKYLVVRTSHRIYQIGDELGMTHQTNCAIEFDTERMEVTDYNCSVGGAGYASHSFNQFVGEQDGKIIGVDQGDGYPRAVTLYEYGSDASTGKFTGRGNGYNFFEIPGEKGRNFTGTTLGGFAITDSTYLVVGTKIDFKNFEIWEQHNIFTSTIDRVTKEAKTTMITNDEYTLDEYGKPLHVSNPQLVEIEKGRYMLLWMKQYTLYYTYIDEYGQRTSEIMSAAGALSDCVPIVTKGKVLWYTWKDGAMTFYSIDLKDNSLSVKENIYGHHYETTKRSGSKATLVCSECGNKTTVTVPDKVEVWFRAKNGWWISPTSILFKPNSFKTGDTQRFYYTKEHNNDYSFTVSDPDVISVQDDRLAYTG
ncbi:MAG: hypothetical protein K2N94_12780, partial [Lachnospiraceae bacterium]|nr:hypothetical protein [Lachnospiraceae bacterium]